MRITMVCNEQSIVNSKFYPQDLDKFLAVSRELFCKVVLCCKLHIFAESPPIKIELNHSIGQDHCIFSYKFKISLFTK